MPKKNLSPIAPNSTDVVYFLRLQHPIGNPETHQAQFYIGFAKAGRLPQRLHEHRTGQGAKFTAYAASVGIGIDLIATVPGDRNFERWLKNKGQHAITLERLLRGALRGCPAPTIYAEL